MKKKRILFLLPPNIRFEDFISPPPNISTIQKNNGAQQFGSLITDIPLGIISLSAYLKKHAPVETKAIDFNVLLNYENTFEDQNFSLYFERILSETKAFDPQYICISALFTPAYHSIVELSHLCAKLFPKAMILAGGNMPTTMYREILNDCPEMDAVCFGEGEKPMLGLLQAKDNKTFLNEHASWITHENLKDQGAFFQHDFIEDLDDIPFLDYDILDLEGYKQNSTLMLYTLKDKASPAEAQKASHSLPIMTSRGCPFRCTFCASHAAHGRKMRYQSVARVQQDIATLKARYGINGLIIQDDHFMGGNQRPFEIVKAIKDLDLKMFFQNALALYALTPEFLKLLSEAGIEELVLPVESGSSRVLKEVMKKPLKLRIVEDVVENCRKYGIYTDCNIILGMPGETIDDIHETRSFLKKIHADWFRVFVAMPLPGSEMYAQCETQNYFKINPLKANYKRAVIETEFMSPEDVQFITYYVNIELNFIYNANIRLGNYETALKSFHNVLSVKPDHALAHYYCGLCHEKLGNQEDSQYHYGEAENICLETDFWDFFIQEFELPIPLYRETQSPCAHPALHL